MSTHEKGSAYSLQKSGLDELRSGRRKTRSWSLCALNRVKSMQTWTRAQHCAHVFHTQHESEYTASLLCYHEQVECLIHGLVFFHVDDRVIESWQTIYRCVEPLLCYKASLRQSFDDLSKTLKSTVCSVVTGL